MLRGMWDLPGPGLEPVSPALAGGFLTTDHQGSPVSAFLRQAVMCTNISSACLSLCAFFSLCPASFLSSFLSFFYPGLFLRPGISKHFHQNALNNQKGQKKDLAKSTQYSVKFLWHLLFISKSAVALVFGSMWSSYGSWLETQSLFLVAQAEQEVKSNCGFVGKTELLSPCRENMPKPPLWGCPSESPSRVNLKHRHHSCQTELLALSTCGTGYRGSATAVCGNWCLC